MPTVLITGANRGLGLEFCRQYAAAGYRVLATCRDPQHAFELKTIAETGQVEVYSLDVTNITQMQQLSQQLADQAIDILINNAGLNEGHETVFGNFTPESWSYIFAVNSTAPMLMAQTFISAIARSKLKTIVNISTVLASMGAPEWQAKYYIYRSSKAALNCSMSNLAVELAPQGIKCLILSPGWVKTDMGGPDAPLFPEQSIHSMRELIDNATMEMSGRFLDYDGREISW